MKFEKARIIKMKNSTEYVIMSILYERGNQYAFATKLIDGNPVNEYSMFTIIDDTVIMLDDEILMKKLLPKFQEDINSDLLKIVGNDDEVI